MNYERIVQWAAGPIAIVSGWLATQITNHLNLLGSLGFSASTITHAQHLTGQHLAQVTSVQTVGQNPIAHAIFNAVTFAVGALVTYAAHHKWLSNVPAWWVASGLTAPADPYAVADLAPEPDPSSYPPADWTPAPDPSPAPGEPDPAPTPPAPSPIPGDPAAALRAQLTAAGFTPDA